MADRDQVDSFKASFEGLSDQAFLETLANFPALAPEGAPEWDEQEYWNRGLYQFLALAEESARRRLEAAIPLLLDRATDFDQDSDLESLRHNFEEIMRPRWSRLADICMEKAHSSRAGTRKWSLYQLTILDDPRAAPLFASALQDPHPDIKGIARIGLDRLANAKPSKRVKKNGQARQQQ